MIRSRKTRSWLMVVAGLMMMLATPATLLAQAPNSSSFLSFGLSGSSNGIGAIFGDPRTQPYPTSAALMPYATTSLDTGPSGYALSSAFWPGPLAANGGSLATLLGAPPEAGAANYPVRAEAFTAGPNKTELGPGFVAEADGDIAHAVATASGFTSTDESSFGSATAESTSRLDPGLGITESTSEVQDISIGGVIEIDSVRTAARATTDGTTATAEGSAVVSGLTIGGQEASVGENGVTFADQSNPSPADAVLAQIGESILAEAGMEMYTTAPVTSVSGPDATYLSGSLVILWKLGDSGYEVIYTIGGSEARVRALPAIDPALVGGPTPTVTTTTQFVASAPPPTVGATHTTQSIAAPAPTAPAPVAAPTPAVAPPPATTPITAQPIFDTYWFGIPWGLILLSIVGSGFLAAGLRRLRDGAFDSTASCPLEGAH